MGKCEFCGKSIESSDLAKGVLNIAEWKRFMKLKKNQNMCNNCKSDYLFYSLM